MLESEAAPTLMTPSQVSGIALRPPPPLSATLQGGIQDLSSAPSPSLSDALLPAPPRSSMAKWVIGGAMVAIGLAVGVGMAMRTRSEISVHPLAPESAPVSPTTLVAPVVEEPVAAPPLEPVPPEVEPESPVVAAEVEPPEEEPAEEERDDEPRGRVRQTMHATSQTSEQAGTGRSERERPPRDSEMAPLLIDEF